MLLNTYPYMMEAFDSPCMIVQKAGYFYERFHSSHFKAWATEIALPLPDKLEGLMEALSSYAESARNLRAQAEGTPFARAAST
jgi:hypothetical protein